MPTPMFKPAVAATAPIPLFPDLAYWMTRCYRANCHNEPTPTPDPRWLGKWCQPCAARLAADAEAMMTMLTTETADV